MCLKETVTMNFKIHCKVPAHDFFLMYQDLLSFLITKPVVNLKITVVQETIFRRYRIGNVSILSCSFYVVAKWK